MAVRGRHLVARSRVGSIALGVVRRLTRLEMTPATPYTGCTGDRRGVRPRNRVSVGPLVTGAGPSAGSPETDAAPSPRCPRGLRRRQRASPPSDAAKVLGAEPPGEHFTHGSGLPVAPSAPKTRSASESSTDGAPHDHTTRSASETSTSAADSPPSLRCIGCADAALGARRRPLSVVPPSGDIPVATATVGSRAMEPARELSRTAKWLMVPARHCTCGNRVHICLRSSSAHHH